MHHAFVRVSDDVLYYRYRRGFASYRPVVDIICNVRPSASTVAEETETVQTELDQNVVDVFSRRQTRLQRGKCGCNAVVAVLR